MVKSKYNKNAVMNGHISSYEIERLWEWLLEYEKKKCIFFWQHKFNKWKIIENGNILSAWSNNVIGKYVIQRRECKKCGLIRFKKIRV